MLESGQSSISSLVWSGVPHYQLITSIPLTIPYSANNTFKSFKVTGGQLPVVCRETIDTEDEDRKGKRVMWMQEIKDTQS